MVTVGLPPLAEIREVDGGWTVSCLACPMTVEARPTVEQAVQDAWAHWRTWHATKEERA